MIKEQPTMYQKPSTEPVFVSDTGKLCIGFQSAEGIICGVCKSYIAPMWFYTLHSYFDPKTRTQGRYITCTDCYPLHPIERVTGTMKPIRRNTEPIRAREIVEAATIRMGAVVRVSTPRPTWMQRVKRKIRKVMLWEANQ